MQTRSIQRPANFKQHWFMPVLTVTSSIAVFLILLGSTIPHRINSVTVTPQEDFHELFRGISFDQSVTDDDRRYLQSSLGWLRDSLPEWYDYVVQAGPLFLSVDTSLSESGLRAVGECCNERDDGMITFAQDFQNLDTSDDPEDRTVEARRLVFLSTLIHEATHIRDQRAGRGLEVNDYQSCITVEKPAYSKELEFKRAVLSARLQGMPASLQPYQMAAEHLLRAKNKVWKLACFLRTMEAPAGLR